MTFARLIPNSYVGRSDYSIFTNALQAGVEYFYRLERMLTHSTFDQCHPGSGLMACANDWRSFD